MSRDIVDLIEPYLSEDQTTWARLASTVQWRRLQLVLLREILIELRKLNRTRAGQTPTTPAVTDACGGQS